MVQYRAADARVFHALGDPTRLRIVGLLLDGERMVSDLAEPLEISLTAVIKQMGVLEKVGLATTEKVGRERICRLRPEPLDDVIDWAYSVRQMWSAKLDSLQAFLDTQGAPS